MIKLKKIGFVNILMVLILITFVVPPKILNVIFIGVLLGLTFARHIINTNFHKTNFNKSILIKTTRCLQNSDRWSPSEVLGGTHPAGERGCEALSSREPHMRTPENPPEIIMNQWYWKWTRTRMETSQSIKSHQGWHLTPRDFIMLWFQKTDYLRNLKILTKSWRMLYISSALQNLRWT